MSAALAQPQPVPVGVIKQFGETGPQYEVLGDASDENGRRMVRIVLVRTGEETTITFNEMIQNPEAR